MKGGIIIDIGKGDFKALAKAVTMVENDLPGSEELLRNLPEGNSVVVGVTGPPGAGKSTLIAALLKELRSRNKKIAVVAVDPSSPFNHGSLLGDRLRMSEHFNDPSVFIRSMASRGSLGGLTEKILEVTDVIRSAGFDLVIVETVGVGQSEVEIAGLADITMVVLVPESGDEVQAMKAGIMEIADIFVVNKADREGAKQFAASLRQMVKERSKNKVPVLETVASTGEGIPGLAEHLLKGNPGSTDSKTDLLTEKAYRLIARKRMSDIDRTSLRKSLEKAKEDKEFNLYLFADSYKP